MVQKTIMVKGERLIVLNGEGKIDEMVVFLASRKLEKILASSEQVQATAPDNQEK